MDEKESKITSESQMTSEVEIKSSDNECEFEMKIESTEETIKTIRREVKVAKTLAIITIAFIICFLPINILTIITSLIKMRNVKLYLDMSAWFMYINSMINPILYAYFNNNFRKAFKNILISWRIIKID